MSVRPNGMARVGTALFVSLLLLLALWAALAPRVNAANAPGIAIDVAEGMAGTVVTVTGALFGADEADIQVTLDGLDIGATTVADAQGGWQVAIIIPATVEAEPPLADDVLDVQLVAPGGHAIDASGASTDAANVPDVTFTVLAPEDLRWLTVVENGALLACFILDDAWDGMVEQVEVFAEDADGNKLVTSPNKLASDPTLINDPILDLSPTTAAVFPVQQEVCAAVSGLSSVQLADDGSLEQATSANAATVGLHIHYAEGEVAMSATDQAAAGAVTGSDALTLQGVGSLPPSGDPQPAAPPLAADPTPTATATPAPPDVGDVASPPGLMLGLAALGLVFILAGAFYLRRSVQYKG